MSTMRQLIFGVDPDTGLSSVYRWPSVVDGNTDDEAIICGYCPSSKSGVISARQTNLFMGTMGAGVTLQAFVDTLAMDHDEYVEASAISGRIDPTYQKGAEPDSKRFICLEFPHINPFAKGLTVQYCRDTENPHKDSAVWDNMYWESGQTRAFFPQEKAMWIHLRVVDESTLVNVNAFGPFIVNYISLGGQDGEV